MHRKLLSVAFLATLFLQSIPGFAQSPSPGALQAYPTRPVRIIVGNAPGGAPDILARALAQKLSEALGHPFVVENRMGAGGSVAGDITAHAAPDGHTLLMVSLTHAIAASMMRKLPYDLAQNFTPVILVATAPQVLVIHPSIPAKTVRDLIALAKARPGQLNYASSGVGGGTHMIAELFRLTAGINIVHVPYKGSGAALVDLISGQVDLSFTGMVSALSYVKSHRVRALAVTGVRRSPALPGVPTMAESGLSGFEASSWYGLAAPAATPSGIVARLNSEISRILESPDFRQLLIAHGANVGGGTPERFGAHIRGEIAKWTRVAKEAKIVIR